MSQYSGGSVFGAVLSANSSRPTGSFRQRSIPLQKRLYSLNYLKERRPWRRVASLPPPGSFFNEKML